MIRITLQTGFYSKTSFVHGTAVIRIKLRTGFSQPKTSFVHGMAAIRVTRQTGFSQPKASFVHGTAVIRITLQTGFFYENPVLNMVRP